MKALSAPGKCAIVSRPVARDTHLLCHRCRVNCKPPSPKTGPGADLAAPIRKERAAAAPTCQIGAVGGAVIGTVREGYGAKERGQESASDRDRRGERVAFLGLLSPQGRIGRTIDPPRSLGVPGGQLLISVVDSGGPSSSGQFEILWAKSTLA